MNSRMLFALAASALFSGCSSQPKAFAGRRGAVELPGFAPATGSHCESSAMLSALAYLGYGVSEADIVGGGGAPSFVLTNDAFPFIGGRIERLRESFLDAARIPYGVGRPSGEDGDWASILGLLDRGLPVLLRVDMRWLPYLYGGKYGSAYMSFGGHWVCLYGLDLDTGIATVTDTDRGGPCRVSVADLDKARRSNTRMFPPRSEYAWIEPRPEGWAFDRDAVTRSALSVVAASYGSGAEATDYPAAPLSGLAGLAAFPEALASWRTVVKPYLLAPAYSFMAGSIERNGTGGSAFRRLFRDFIAARSADCVDPRLRAACASLIAPAEASVAAWSALAAAFDEASASLGAAKGAAAKAAEAATAGKARAVYEAERALRDAIAAAIE